MIGEVTQRGLPHLPRVPQLHVNRPYKKKNFARAAHCFLHFFAFVVATWNFLVTRFMEKMLYVLKKMLLVVFLFAFYFIVFFFTAAHLHLAGH